MRCRAVEVYYICFSIINTFTYQFKMNNTMNCDAEKSKPLTKEETRVLIDLVASSNIINNKATNATSNKLKTEEWVRITQCFNATASTSRRQPQQLRLKWENLKKNSRKRSTKIRMNNIQTGGGAPDYIPPDDILDRVASLLGSTATGFTVPFGGDREPETFIVVGGGDGGSGEASTSAEAVTPSVTVGLENYHMEGPDIQSVENNIVVTECEVLDIGVQPTPKRFTFETPRNNTKKKRKPDGGDASKTARNLALADYYKAKKQCVDAKLINLQLENEKLKLENERLKWELEKLKA